MKTKYTLKRKEETPEGFLKKPTTQGFPPFEPLQQLTIQWTIFERIRVKVFDFIIMAMIITESIFTPKQPLAPCQINDTSFTAPLPDEMQIREGFIHWSFPPNGTMSDAWLNYIYSNLA